MAKLADYLLHYPDRTAKGSLLERLMDMENRAALFVMTARCDDILAPLFLDRTPRALADGRPTSDALAEALRAAVRAVGEKALSEKTTKLQDERRADAQKLWKNDMAPLSCHRVTVIGTRIEIQSANMPTPSTILARQALAFGPEVNSLLKQLSVAVVGCGGTGSPVVQLLARLGVGRIIVIDDDVVEHSNLNRLHGATRKDADNAVSKVDVMAREVTRMGLDVAIRSMKGWVDAPQIRDALKSCDVIF